jgi:hypothetical protein
LEPDEWVLPKINVLEPRSSPGADHRRDKPTAVPKRSRIAPKMFSTHLE